MRNEDWTAPPSTLRFAPQPAAPWSSSTDTVSAWPFAAARCSAVACAHTLAVSAAVLVSG